MRFMAREQEIGAYSAYAIAVKYGYVGTEEEWIKEQERNRKAAAQSASDASNAKTAAEAAQRAAENAKAGAESAKSAAADSATSARLSVSKAAQSASDAESAKTAAGEAQKAAESAKSAAAVSASLAQTSAAQAVSSAERADSAKTAAAQSEQRTSASEANVAQAEERINTAVSGAVEAVTAQETKSVQAVAAQGEASAAAVTAEGERVLGTIPEDYTAAVREIDTLKKSKAEIDDTAIDGDTWSSKHIVDMLCPKVEKSGTLVQMDGLVEGYPLGVKASWELTQEGSGTPYPAGGGKNLWGNLLVKFFVGQNGKLSAVITAKTTAKIACTEKDVYTLSNSDRFTSPPGNAGVIAYFDNSDNMLARESEIKDGSLTLIAPAGTAYVRASCYAPTDDDKIQFEKGATATAYAPYENIRPIKGRTEVKVERREDNLAYTLTLPSAVCDGEVDADGKGQETWKLVTLDGTEEWNLANGYCEAAYESHGIPSSNTNLSAAKLSQKADRYIIDNPYMNTLADKCAWVYSSASRPYANLRIKHADKQTSLDSWKSYLAAQYAAGTPVQVAYRLADPKPFTATGGAAIPALSGTNTVLTDADNMVVTGRADPIQTVAKLSDRIAALESAATNITE